MFFVYSHFIKTCVFLREVLACGYKLFISYGSICVVPALIRVELVCLGSAALTNSYCTPSLSLRTRTSFDSNKLFKSLVGCMLK